MKQENNPSAPGKSVAGQALMMSFGTLSSRVLGLARETLLAAFFEKTITDAWIAAFRIPNLFRRLLGEGSLSVSFIPVFIDLRTHHPDRDGAPSPAVQNLLNGFYTLLLLILSTLTVVGLLKPEFFVNLILDVQAARQSGTYELTLRLSQIMFGFLFFISTYAYYMGILNALGYFGWAAMAPLFFNVAMIISTLIPQTWFFSAGDGLAYGVLVGGALQALVLIPQLRKLHYWPRLHWRIWSPEIQRIWMNMIPGLLGLALMQVTLIVNTRFASQLGTGSISYIYWADRLLELPLSLISVSLGTALLPTLSGMWSRSATKEYAETAHFYLRMNLFLSLACAVGIGVLTVPIVQIVFERGHFNAQDTAAASQVLFVYAFMMIPVSAVRILAPCYYAVKNTWLPAVSSLLGLGLHLLLAPLWMQSYGLMGLNLSSLVTAMVNFLILFLAFPIFLTSFSYKSFLVHFCKYVLCGIVLAMGLSSYFFVVPFAGEHFIGRLISFVVAVLVGGALFVTTAKYLRLDVYEASLGRLVQKVLRRVGWGQ